MSESIRKVIEVIEPQMVIEGAGVLLRRSFGPKRENRYDPFLLFDHFAFNEPSDTPIAGFPTHPHRGIETVTYMLEGNVRHRDSLGNMGIIGPGDVQWMTSGSGIMHEEMPQRSPSGRVDGFQLWVNLPAEEKMSHPRYQEIKDSEIPISSSESAKVRVIAGSYMDNNGPVTEIAAQPLYMDVELAPGSSFTLPVPATHTLLVYVFEGQGLFGGSEVGGGQHIEAVRMVEFGAGDTFRVETGLAQGIRFVLMAGAPFGEPIVPYGPFVMNTEAEIQQAFVDLRNGTFVKHVDLIG